MHSRTRTRRERAIVASERFSVSVPLSLAVAERLGEEKCPADLSAAIRSADVEKASAARADRRITSSVGDKRESNTSRRVPAA